jgi:3',5'-cyclic AMP phosphodiesterase CpdA
MILHLSDLHFGTEQENCLKAIREFCLEYPLEAVVVSGDLTQRARYLQFFHCKKFLESLGLPYIVIPGNHDIPLFHLWKRFWKPFGRYQFFFGDMEQTLETDHFYIMGLNTIHPKFHTKGMITDAQIKKINQQLAKAPDQKQKILLTHQPFFLGTAEKNLAKDRPVNSVKALRAWAEFGLNAVLHGHLHQSAVFDLNEIYQLGADHEIFEVHAGTATSYRLHGQSVNSFNLIYPDLKVEVFKFDQTQLKFTLH